MRSQFYDLPDLDADILGKGEDDPTSDVYGIEKLVEEYMRSASNDKKSNDKTSGENAKISPQGASKPHQALKRRHPKLAPPQHIKRKFKRFRRLQAM